MRICLYTATALPKLGGQEAVVDALARHFTRLGHRAIVLAARPRLPLRPHDSVLPYPVVRHPRFFSTQYFVSFYRRFLLKLHKTENFDIIHCHDVYPTGYVASLCQDEIHAPLVVTSHGGDVKEGNIRISKPGMLPRYIRGVESADALVSIGNFTSAGFRRLHRGNPRIVTLPNGIDLQPFAITAARPDHLDAAIRSSRFILLLGRLKKRKGVDILLKAAALAPPDAEMQYVIAGAGEDESELKSLAENLGITDRVRFVGRVDGSHKIWLLQNALCVAMPSRTWEAFPLVLLESYAAGRAVVGSQIPGIEDMVQQGRTGLLVPEESPDLLAHALGKLIADPHLARQMGENARQVAQDYSWDAIARKHLQLYASLIEAKR